MTIYAWIEYSYYDGMWCFAQVIGHIDPGSPIKSACVRWLNSEWSS